LPIAFAGVFLQTRLRREFYLKRETTISPNGEATVTETRAARVTYPQNWHAYNAAQSAEKELFCHLLRDLCSNVPGPERGMGRPYRSATRFSPHASRSTPA
jgi:hypothetical protein